MFYFIFFFHDSLRDANLEVHQWRRIVWTLLHSSGRFTNGTGEKSQTDTCLVTQILGVSFTSPALQLMLSQQKAPFPREELWSSRPLGLHPCTQHRDPSPLRTAQRPHCKAQYRPPPCLSPVPSSLFPVNYFTFCILLFLPNSLNDSFLLLASCYFNL